MNGPIFRPMGKENPTMRLRSVSYTHLAVNTEADPEKVVPVKSAASRIDGGKLSTVLGKHSWNMIRLAK